MRHIRNQQKDERERKIRRWVVVSSTALGILGIIVCGYGHAASSTDLMVSGEATVQHTPKFGSVKYMQDMTTAVCNAAEVGTEQRLIDRRDNKKYWVRKMADGTCWMVQNLAYDLEAGVNVPWQDTDIDTNWAPNSSTTSETPSSATITTSKSGHRSWNFGEYVVRENRAGYDITCSDTNTKIPGAASCPAGLMPVGSRKASENPDFFTLHNWTYTDTEYDAHYLIGNYYQYNAITMGTGANSKGTAKYSLCPKGWKLPRAGSTTSTDWFKSMISAEKLTSEVSRFYAPTYFTRAGLIVPTSNYYQSVGSHGYYWTATSYSANANSVYVYRTNEAGRYIVESTSAKARAQNVRCRFYGE